MFSRDNTCPKKVNRDNTWSTNRQDMSKEQEDVALQSQQKDNPDNMHATIRQILQYMVKKRQWWIHINKMQGQSLEDILPIQFPCPYLCSRPPSFMQLSLSLSMEDSLLFFPLSSIVSACRSSSWMIAVVPSSQPLSGKTAGNSPHPRDLVILLIGHSLMTNVLANPYM